MQATVYIYICYAYPSDQPLADNIIDNCVTDFLLQDDLAGAMVFQKHILLYARL